MKLSELLRERVDKLRHAWDDDPTNNHNFIDGESIDPILGSLCRLVDAAEWSAGLARADFHTTVCIRSMSCQCKPSSLDLALTDLRKELEGEGEK